MCKVFKKERHFAGFKVKIILKELILRYWVSLMVLNIFLLKSYTHTPQRYGKNTEKLTEKKLLHNIFKVTGRICIQNLQKGSF